jgi:hypothetical protein
MAKLSLAVHLVHRTLVGEKYFSKKTLVFCPKNACQVPKRLNSLPIINIRIEV